MTICDNYDVNLDIFEIYVCSSSYMKTTGQTTEAAYKYEGKEGSCRAAGKPHNAKVTNYFKTTKGDENMLKDWVATYGVHSVVIEINDGFKSYKKGVMSQSCSNTR